MSYQISNAVLTTDKPEIVIDEKFLFEVMKDEASLEVLRDFVQRMDVYCVICK